MPKEINSAKPEKRLLSTTEAANYLGCSASKLAKSRIKGYETDGPPFLKLGQQVLYRISDLDRWLDEYLVDPKSGDRE